VCHIIYRVKNDMKEMQNFRLKLQKQKAK
jgi:hypothetical protein